MTVQVGSLIYRASNLPQHAAAVGAVSDGIPAMLFGSLTKLWKFVDADALVKALAVLRQANWTGALATAPSALSVNHTAPSGAEKAGTVRIGRGQAAIEYPTLLALQQTEVYQALVQGAAWLGSPGFAALAADTVAERWRFTDWGEVDNALQGWVPGAPYSQQLTAHRVVRHPPSVLAWYDPATMTFGRSQFLNFFGACGPTAKYLLGRVQDLGGEVQLVAEEFRLSGPNGAAKLAQLVQADYPGPVLINVVNDAIHEFVLERATDGTAALFQGYIGAYDALWWAELNRAEVTVSGNELITLQNLRTTYGGGRAVPLPTLLTNLGTFMGVDQLRNAGIAWRALPFLPKQNFNDDGLPCFDVRVWQVTDPQAVLNALRTRQIIDQQFTSWLSLAVLKEAEKAAPQ
ncbi:hypothetical protein O7634_21475 [Micromonospora sp. WMMD1120]|uniref:hypothetical protein n=1 Tax=Micromonospora sp. WMMD1120 TaxID=3016106 RepID=UPI002415A8BC|nr:hypothetical protein [Micromonospora sp. WMMD1120]MDG4809324.1 hypothetical protein [Micromonospora sp. WMMD1120]